jgi:hypothetical protein
VLAKTSSSLTDHRLSYSRMVRKRTLLLVDINTGTWDLRLVNDMYKTADHSCHEQWDRGFEPQSRHECLSTGLPVLYCSV